MAVFDGEDEEECFKRHVVLYEIFDANSFDPHL